VANNTDRLLDLFAATDVKATFFTLAWVAERNPGLVRRIAEAGHEVASHGYCHERVDSQTPEAFRADIRKSRDILQDLSGVNVHGYRAATFSVGAHTPWAWPILEEEGYAYSSSVYPVKRDFYGMPDAPRTPYRPEGTSELVEIPISTVHLAGRNWPCGGGGYFRFLPYEVSRAAIERVNRVDRASAVFYIHPWEVDPGQPRAKGVPFKSSFRHYLNLAKTHGRLARLSRAFRWDRMDRTFNVGPGAQAERAAAPARAVA
jgi:polysaccharide deacetylase family protein (PEP-CTERM system associated)